MSEEPGDHSVARLGEATDAALARRAGLGDDEAFNELFHRHFPGTFTFALHLLDGEDALAQDVTQEAWVKVWRGIDGFANRSRLRTWLFSIVSREALSARRRRRPVVVDDETLEQLHHQPVGDEDATPDEAERQRWWRELTLALTELPWRQREAFLLREFEQMTYAEIAVVLDTTTGTVRGLLHRARRTLAVRMEQWR